MKKILLISFLQFILLNVDVRNIQSGCTSQDCSDTIGKRALQYTNTFRMQNGRSPLAWNEVISKIGRAFAIRLGRHIEPFGHQGFNCRVSLFPLSARAAGENLFFGSSSGDIARIAVNAWIASPGHRANLLGNYNYCAVGVFQNPQGVYYFVQLFALF